jgi:hypothetical protein
MRQEDITITVDDLLDRERIRHVFARYSRAMDRQDADLLASVYWPDGWDDHGVFEGTPADFIDNLETLWNTFRMVHITGQSYIELDGPIANAETYFIAYHRVGTGAATIDMFNGGRYVDRLEKRGDEWRILHRTAVYDWTRELGASDGWDTPVVRGDDPARPQSRKDRERLQLAHVREPADRAWPGHSLRHEVARACADVWRTKPPGALWRPRWRSCGVAGWCWSWTTRTARTRATSSWRPSSPPPGQWRS